MSKKHILGLVTVELADLAVDGDIGTVWNTIGDTVPGSASFTTEEGTTTDFFTEESDTAIESIVSDPGATNFVWSTHNVEADVMIRLFGGTKSGAGPVIYTPPDTVQAIEQSLRITDKKGNILKIVRASLKPRLALNFNKTALGQIDITAAVLTPTKSGVKAWTFSTPTA